MKTFKSIRESYSGEPGVSQIDNVPEDPMTYVEIKPKKTKVVKEAMSDGDKSSVALQAMVAKKNLQQTAGKNKSQAFVDKMVSKANAGDRLPKRPNDEYDRKVTTYLKKKYNEEAEQMDELNKDTVYSYAAKAEKDADRKHKALTFQIKSNNPLSANKTADKIIKRYRGMDRAENRLNKEETEQVNEGDRQALAKKLTNKMYSIGKGLGKLAKSQNNTNIVTNLKNTKSDMHKAVGMANNSTVKKMLNKEETEQMDEKVTSKDIKMAVGVAKDKRYAGGNMSGAVKTMEKMKPGLSKHPRVQQVLKSTNEDFDKLSPQQKAHQYNLDSAQREIDRRHGEGEDMSGAKINKKTYEINKPKKLRVSEGVDFLKVWDSIKPVYEDVKTTHEDPLVVTKDEEGHIHTHANLSVANAIHGTNVKHQAIHTYKKVQDGKFTFELSKHHEGALKEDAPFDPVAHKKEHDRLITKHIMAHKALMASPGEELKNKQMERLNAVKREIRNHKDKVPAGPAPKPGSAAEYYANKKPGEYTGD